MSDSLPASFDLDALCEVFRSAEKPKSSFRLGLESEKFGLHRDGSPLVYEGPLGVEGLFTALLSRGYSPIREAPDGPVLGLRRGDESITLEPAAQVELSGAPQRDVHELERELRAHLAEVQAASPSDVSYLHLGFHPLARPDDLSWVPKLRYPVMRTFLPTRGRRGLDMMQRTATVQVNLDFENEADAMLRLCTLFRVTPFLQAMMLNAPFFEGRISSLLSERLDVWLNMDPARSGLVPDLWNTPNPSYRTYAAWAARAPMFLFMRGTTLHRNTGQTFEAFWKDGFEGERPTTSDWKVHLGTLFPEVRLKTTLEVRGVDSQRPDLALALPAFLAGLSYDSQALQGAAALLEPLTLDQANDLRIRIRTEGLRARWNGAPVQKTALELLDLASGGLGRRALVLGVPDERAFLTPLRELVERGITPAERALEAFRSSGLTLPAFVQTLTEPVAPAR